MVLSVSLQLYHLHYLFLIPHEMHLLPPVGKEEQVMEVVKMQRDRGHNLPRPSDHLCRRWGKRKRRRRRRLSHPETLPKMLEARGARVPPSPRHRLSTRDAQNHVPPAGKEEDVGYGGGSVQRASCIFGHIWGGGVRLSVRYSVSHRVHRNKKTRVSVRARRNGLLHRGGGLCGRLDVHPVCCHACTDKLEDRKK